MQTNHDREVKASGHHRADIARARQIRHGLAGSGDDLVALAKRLTKARLFSQGRRMLARVLQSPEVQNGGAARLGLVHYYALCCSEDQGLRSHQELGRALNLLKETVDLARTRDAKTLSIAGAVHMRLWELNAHKNHLERALAYYRRSYEHGTGKHRGYAGVHAAFLLDVVAQTEEREATQTGTLSESAAARREQAREIRTNVAATLPKVSQRPGQQHLLRNWRYLVRVAEVYFGLKNYVEARSWLEKAAALHAPERDFEATARHLAMLARLQEGDSVQQVAESPAWSCLRALVGSDAIALPSATLGKMGLALSGGGFRAALFHVGVLARLAELDVLRHVEVLSCVSGGSIVGAHYYLEVRKLLQEKTDAEITREDYIAIVQRIEGDLLAGIQENIRMRVAADGLAILRVIFDRDYSRIVRAGELYEQEIYARVDDDKRRRMSDIKIVPRGGPANFHPRHHNWRRSAPTSTRSATRKPMP